MEVALGRRWSRGRGWKGIVLNRAERGMKNGKERRGKRSTGKKRRRRREARARGAGGLSEREDEGAGEDQQSDACVNNHDGA